MQVRRRENVPTKIKGFHILGFPLQHPAANFDGTRVVPSWVLDLIHMSHRDGRIHNIRIGFDKLGPFVSWRESEDSVIQALGKNDQFLAITKEYFNINIECLLDFSNNRPF